MPAVEKSYRATVASECPEKNTQHERNNVDVLTQIQKLQHKESRNTSKQNDSVSTFEKANQEHVAECIRARNALSNGVPLVGDYVIINGKMRRISVETKNGLQWTKEGSFYISGSGHSLLSCGSSEPPLPFNEFQKTEDVHPGEFRLMQQDKFGGSFVGYMTMNVRVWQHVSKDGSMVMEPARQCKC